MGSSWTSSIYPLGEDGANTGQTLDIAHWITWAPLDNTGSWKEGCGLRHPQPLSSTHWTLLAENLGNEEDKKGRKIYPVSTPGIVLSFGFSPSSETLDLRAIPAPNPQSFPTSTCHVVARTSLSLYVSVE